MNILEWIKTILGNGKKNAKFYTKTLKKNIGESEALQIGLYDGETPITDEEIGIEINGKQYIKKTDENGIGTLNINLGVGKYTAKVYWRGNQEYNNITAYAEVIITTDTYMDGINLSKNQGESTPYQCALYRSDNGERIKDKIKLTINSKTYTREADNDGLYKLNINLPEGTYNIKAEFTGNELFNPSIIENTIIINKPTQPSGDKKPIILGCDANTSDDSYVQNHIAERLEAEGYTVEKLPIGPNYFASTDYSSKAKGKIGIYLIASGIFSIADAAYGSGQFDNYIFGIRGDFGDKGATCFDCPISADADCTSICDELDGKTFNQINNLLQPYVSVCGGSNTDELSNNIINWLKAITITDDPEPPAPEETPETPTGQESRHVKVLNYFEDHFGECQYIDDALEKIQGKGYAFYFSDGYNMYETIERIANGEGANCFDAAEVFYHLAKGMNEKYGRNYSVEYLDVWCPVSGYDHIRLRLNNGEVTFYRDPACVLDGGDITDNWCGTSDNILEVNPSWIYDK